MTSKQQKNPNSLRGNQDIFLGDIINSQEFKDIKSKHLPKDNYFIGIHQLLGHIDDSEVGLAIKDCVDEVSKKFKLKFDTAQKLVLSNPHTLPINMNYIPTIYSDSKYVYVRIGPKTTQSDITNIWDQVRSEQRKLGNVGSKTSINPELAFCIHRQYIFNNKTIKEIYDEYLDEKLAGYKHPATINDIKDFKKYYDKTVRGILIP